MGAVVPIVVHSLDPAVEEIISVQNRSQRVAARLPSTL